MTQSDGNDSKLLDELTMLAAEIENHVSSNHLCFAAASAYYNLVEQRLIDFREERIQGIQTIGEFLKRRLKPAVNICRSTANRFSSLSERVGNTSQLLRTRVDIICGYYYRTTKSSFANVSEFTRKNAIANAANGRRNFSRRNYLLRSKFDSCND